MRKRIQAMVMLYGFLRAVSAFGEPSNDPDLRALEEAVRSSSDAVASEIKLSSLPLNIIPPVKDGKMYVLTRGDYTIKVGEEFIIIEKGGVITTTLYDIGKNRTASRIIQTIGALTEKEISDMDLEGLVGSSFSILKMRISAPKKKMSPYDTRKVVDAESMIIINHEKKNSVYITEDKERKDQTSFREYLRKMYDSLIEEAKKAFDLDKVSLLFYAVGNN